MVLVSGTQQVVEQMFSEHLSCAPGPVLGAGSRRVRSLPWTGVAVTASASSAEVADCGPIWGLSLQAVPRSESRGVLSEMVAHVAQVPFVLMVFLPRLGSQAVVYVLISDVPFLITMWKATSMNSPPPPSSSFPDWLWTFMADQK